MVTSALFFLLKIVLAIQDILWAHMHFRIIYSFSLKNDIIISLTIAFGFILFYFKLKFHSLHTLHPDHIFPYLRI